MWRWMLWLGHGRALEANYIGLKFLYGLFFLVCPGHEAIDVRALYDLQWYLPASAIAAPFFIIAFTQLCGMILNIRGYEISWVPRFAGASMGIMLWSWLVAKSIAISAVVTALFPIAIMGILASMFILWKAANRLPIPGTPGIQ